MADANVHLEIGPQYVEAAREAVEKAVAPFRNVGEYKIGADVDDDEKPYVFAWHQPCQRWIYGGSTDAHQLDVAALLSQIAAHQCEAQRG
ncbi:MAG TPA: hypothetical protein VGD91_24950 [Trebonia sp.]